jgi:hypothetical protein
MNASAWVAWLCCLWAQVGAWHVRHEQFERIRLIEHSDFNIDLMVRPVATLADDEFIGFLITNKVGLPLELPPDTIPRWLIHNVVFTDLSTGQRRDLEVLINGMDELFYGDREDPEVHQPPLRVGQARHMRYLSAMALTNLGLHHPDEPARLVEARISLELTYRDDVLRTPRGGIPFKFVCKPPGAERLPEMQARLREVLYAKTDRHWEHQILTILMAYPGVGEAMSDQELLAGLNKWGGRGLPIIAFIDKHRGPGPLLLRHALDVIERRDGGRLYVLAGSSAVLDPLLIEPLRPWATAGVEDGGSECALTLLTRHLDLAPNRRVLSAELGTAWLAHCPIFREGKLTKENAHIWRTELAQLALTRDHSLIRLLRPYLDRHDIIDDANQHSLYNDGGSVRVRDVIYNTMMDILERDGERFSVRYGHGPARPRTPDMIFAHRDALIEALVRELDTP